MKAYKVPTKIGYLGGGQLARMLAQSALQMGLTPLVLSPNSQDPGAECGLWQKGNLNNRRDLEIFLKKVEVTGFESEFMDASLLSKASKNTNAKIFPCPQLMGLLQDRKTQKELFDKNRLNTAPWTPLKSFQDVQSFISTHNYPVVFKKRLFGYDGYGTWIIKNKSSLNRFCEQNLPWDSLVLEKFIFFKKECAVILARSRDQSFTHLPFVESFQEQARCDWVKGPTKPPGHRTMVAKLKAFLKRIHYVGVMGVEFFMTDKDLILNEIAPRVHNTGHYSLDTEGPSQFDLHNRCLLGLELPKPVRIQRGFAMVNLIGRGGAVKLKAMEGLHWYGKKENHKGRKMGHINVVANSPHKALTEALKKRKSIRL